MILINEIMTWQNLIQFVLWAAATLSVSHFIFRSLPAAELGARIRQYLISKTPNYEILLWELKHRVRYSKRLAMGDETATVTQLTPDEINDRAAKLKQMSTGTISVRVVNFLLECAACQMFWSALIVNAITREFSIESIATCLAYVTIGSLLYTSKEPKQSNGKTGYPTCGR